MQVLLALAQAAGGVVSRADIEQSVWPGRVVTDDAVTNAVVKLRKALRDNPRQPKVVETIAKRGYRLLVQPDFAAAPEPEHRAPLAPRQKKAVFALVLLLSAAISVLLVRFVSNSGEPSPPLPHSAPSIAVIPLETLGGSDSQGYFAQGITLDLITELSRVDGLLVISPGTAFQYRDINVDHRQIRAETGVSYLVRGGVQRSGDRLRVNIRLVETASGRTLWADRFGGGQEQVFEIQDRLVSGIADALRQQLGQRFATPKRDAITRSIAAYDAFLRGQESYGRLTPDDNREARAHFEHAIGLDPGFSRAYAGLALTWSRKAVDGWTSTPEMALAKAIDLAAKASDLDPDIPQVHFVKAQVELFRRHHELAAAAASEAIKLNPNYADAYALLAWIFHYAGRPDQALPVMQEALKRNPSSPASYHQTAGEIHFTARRYRQASTEFQVTLAKNPAHMRARLWLAATHLKLDQRDQAMWEAQEVLGIYPDFSLSQLPHAFPFKDPRQLATLEEALRQLGLPE
ncbi:MAG: winged helix-turn-helix domain-containing protein [Gammaproteobacteria bacterium]|nr:winged helix-turn-helix domain-containing protein [Gammaproteobacteria bacterium]